MKRKISISDIQSVEKISDKKFGNWGPTSTD